MAIRIELHFSGSLNAWACHRPLVEQRHNLGGGASGLGGNTALFAQRNHTNRRVQLLLPSDLWNVSRLRRTAVSEVRASGGNIWADEPILGTGHGQSHPKNASTRAKKGSLSSETARPPSESPECSSVAKVCASCQRPKLRVDFLKTASTIDGRTDNCRACLAVVKAKRSENELHHLALSVEAAWAQAKACKVCGLTKERRDFIRQAAAKDGTSNMCRACKSAQGMKSPTNTQSMEPLQCKTCLEVKAPEQFSKNWSHRSGRCSTCKACECKRRKENRHRVKELQVFVHRQVKVCTRCHKEKGRVEFANLARFPDGLNCICRACDAERISDYRKRRKKQQLKGSDQTLNSESV